MIYQRSLGKNHPYTKKVRRIGFNPIPNLVVIERRVLGGQERCGPDRRPDLIKMAKGADLQEEDIHPKDLADLREECPQKRLSEELTPELMKVSRIATAGHAVHQDIFPQIVLATRREEYGDSSPPQTSRKPYTIRSWYKYTNSKIYPRMRVYMSKKKSSAKKSQPTQNQPMDLNPTTSEEIAHQEGENRHGYFSHLTLSQNMIDKIMKKTLNIQKYQGFSASHIDQVLQNFSMRNRKSYVVYGITRREMSLPIEYTGNQVEMQLIPREDVGRDLANMKPEVAQKMCWIHIGAIQLVLKSTLSTGVDAPINIAVCDRRIRDLESSVLGTISGNLYAGKVVGIIYPKIAYNLNDTHFSRALTLYQDFKRQDLMEDGNRPYSITYQVSYALSNSHHTELFLGKQFIEIPDIFKSVTEAIIPGRMDSNTREPPRPRRFDLQIRNKEIMVFEKSQSLRIDTGRLSFQGDRIQSQPFGRKFIEEAPSSRTLRISKIAVTIKCPEGWRAITVRFDTTR